MRRNSALSVLNFLLACLCLFVFHCSAAITFAERTSSCTPGWAIGQSVFCCNGACLDGTSTFSTVGLCRYFADGCNNPIKPPACASYSQVFVFDNFHGIDAGISGLCYPISGFCTWGQFNYTWNCCECPSGFVAVANDCPSLSRPNSYECVSCAPGEALSVDLTTLDYICVDASLKLVFCKTGDAVQNLIAALGLLSSFIGTICPTKDLISVVTTVLGNAYSVLDAARDPKNGYLGSIYGAETTVLSSLESFVLGALVVSFGSELTIFGAIPVALVGAYTLMCNLNGVIGPLLTIGSAAGSFLQQHQCPASSKRSISSGTSGEFIPPTLDVLPRRDVYNPCAEAVSIFPVDYSIPATLNDACNQIRLYNAASTNDTTMANALTTLQQFCANYQESGTSDLLMNFANMLSALEAAVPYCNSTATGPTFTLSGTSSATSTSLPSSLSSTTGAGVSTTTSATSSTIISMTSYSSSTTTSTMTSSASSISAVPTSSSSTSSSSSFSSSTKLSSSSSVTSTSSSTSKTTSTTSSQTSSTATGTPKWSQLGCFTDNVLGKGCTLTKRKSLPGGSGVMTVKACEEACQKASYIYAGLEHAGECWCGNTFANGGVYLGPDGTNGCTTPCAGDAGEICGGGKRLSVYGWG